MRAADYMTAGIWREQAALPIIRSGVFVDFMLARLLLSETFVLIAIGREHWPGDWWGPDSRRSHRTAGSLQ